MILGIDASNLRRGGGVTHLVELLRAAVLPLHGFTKIVVWSGRSTLARVEERSWLVKRHVPELDRGLPYRAFWQRFRLSAYARAAGCDALLVPGGAYGGDFRPIVTMSRNLLPFEWRELRRYGASSTALRLLLLRFVQARTFKRADGVVFLTRYAREVVTGVTGELAGRIAMIPHGIDARFLMPPRRQRPIETCSVEKPFRLVYVSIIDVYKHQWHVAEAVGSLRREGLPLELLLVGPAYAPALQRLRTTLARVDPKGEFVRYLGAVEHTELHAQYASADLCVFASSCENMPNILVEGMASGLPIACARRGPMPEVLGAAGLYFDPEDVDDIARTLRTMIGSAILREQLAQASFSQVKTFSWRRCADETFGFLAAVAGRDDACQHPESAANTASTSSSA